MIDSDDLELRREIFEAWLENVVGSRYTYLPQLDH